MKTKNTEVTKEKHPVFEVTPLSKYLALILFIVMPFIGGWIGYTYAPDKFIEIEKIVYLEEVSTINPLEGKEVFILSDNYVLVSYPCNIADFSRGLEDECYRLVITDNQKSEIIIDNLTEHYRSTFARNNDLAIERLYSPGIGNKIYFSEFLPGSDGCCGLVEYDYKNDSFIDGEYSLGSANGAVKSESGRLIAKTTGTQTIEIFDVVAESVIQKITLNDGENVWSSRCGFAGNYTDTLKWIDQFTIEYGVYEMEYTLNQDCDAELRELRRAEVNIF